MQKQAQKRQIQSVHSLRILIATSDPGIRDEMRGILTSAGHIVVGEAEEGCEALLMARGLRPDLVVMSSWIDGMDCVRATELLTLEKLAPVVLLIAETDSPMAEGHEILDEESARMLEGKMLYAPVIERTRQELVRDAIRSGVMAILNLPVAPGSIAPALEIARARWAEERNMESRLARLKEKEETREIVDAAKRVLIVSCGLTETRAYRALQLRSMNTRRSLREVAQAVIDSRISLPAPQHRIP